jgi:hypothetical protein
MSKMRARIKKAPADVIRDSLARRAKKLKPKRKRKVAIEPRQPKKV